MSTEDRAGGGDVPVCVPAVDDTNLMGPADGPSDRRSEGFASGSTVVITSGLTGTTSAPPEVTYDSVSYIRKSFTDKNISEKATNIIMCSWRSTTQKQYNSAIKKWLLFCNKWKISSVQPSISVILEYLSELFDSNLGYSAINTTRSALSSIGITIDGFTVGAHPLIVRFLKGVYNLRPSVPRYKETWDVSIVLKYLRSLSPVASLSLKHFNAEISDVNSINFGMPHTVIIFDRYSAYEKRKVVLMYCILVIC